MQEGSIFFVLGFPSPWPLTELTNLATMVYGPATIRILAHPDGHLNFVVEEAGQENINYHSQSINLEGTGRAILSFVWNAPSVSLHISGSPILNFSEANGATHTVALSNHNFEELPSFAQPMAREACKIWMDWRREQYIVRKGPTRKNRRIKTEAEQIEELERSMASLIDVLDLMQRGKTHFIGYLAAELRALLYWNGKNYNPLLLRLAAHFDLPLPVFMLRAPENEPDIITQANVHFGFGEHSIIKTLPNQELVDIQEWLTSTILTADFPRVVSNVTQNERETIAAKKLIVQAASVLGSSHYDEDLPDNLEFFQNLRDAHFDAITTFLLRTTALVVELGHFVLSSTQSHGTSSVRR